MTLVWIFVPVTVNCYFLLKKIIVPYVLENKVPLKIYVILDINYKTCFGVFEINYTSRLSMNNG